MPFRKYHLYFNIILFAIVNFYFLSCKSKSLKIAENVSRVNPPIPSINIKYEEYVFHSDSTFSISLKSGTVIRIPKNAFIDSSGNPFRGSITFKVREFHNAEDIFKAGVPMNIQNASMEYLQSGGMIDLRAFSGNQNLELDSSKNINISLAGYKKTIGYQLYHLENDNIWSVRDTFFTQKNTFKIQKLDSLESALKNGKKEDYYIRIVADYEHEPKLKKVVNIEWKIDASDINDEFINAMRINWDEIKVVERRNSKYKYQLTFKRKFRKKDNLEILKTFKINATPVKDKKELNEKEKKEFDYDYKEYIKYKKFIEQQADLLNSFSIQKLGIWNIDKILKLDNTIYKSVAFDFISKIDPIENNLKFYLLLLDDNSVFEYSAKNWNKVVFKKNSNMELRMVLPGGKLVLINKHQISAAINNLDDKIVFKTE